MGFSGELCCAHCGSECHLTMYCSYIARTQSSKTLTVTLRGVCTEYVTKDAFDALVLVHEALQVAADRQRKDAQMKIAALEHALPRACDCKDRIEAIQRRYEAELDLYRHPLYTLHPVPLVSMSSLTYKCDCGAVCSSRSNLVSHVRTESQQHDTKVRARHIAFAAALDTLYPPPR